jgi:hypothetical protein
LTIIQRRSWRLMTLLSAAALAWHAGRGSSVDAATISWGPATDISSSTEVSTQGTLVDAVYFRVRSPDLGVNGVTFSSVVAATNTTSGTGVYQVSETGSATDPIVATLDQPSSYQGPPTTTGPDSANYDAILTYLGYQDNPNETSTVYLNGGPGGLILGDTYQVQFWASQVSAGNTAVLSGDPSVTLTADGDNHQGQFSIGTFIATSSSQSFTFTSQSNAVVDAIQLRNLGALPEPATISLLGIGVVTLLTRRRRA